MRILALALTGATAYAAQTSGGDEVIYFEGDRPPSGCATHRARRNVASVALLLLFTGCATLRDRACKEVCVDDTCVHYCETQERVTLRCAKNAFKADTGDVWREDGTYIGADGKIYCIAACTEHYPDHKYPFHVWLWTDEAWRRSHEDCHIAVWKRGGSFEDHQRECHDFGLNRGRRRM